MLGQSRAGRRDCGACFPCRRTASSYAENPFESQFFGEPLKINYLQLAFEHITAACGKSLNLPC